MAYGQRGWLALPQLLLPLGRSLVSRRHRLEAARPLLATLRLLGVEMWRLEMHRARLAHMARWPRSIGWPDRGWLDSFVDGRGEGREGGIGGKRGCSPPLTLLKAARGHGGEGPIRPSCQGSGLHHIQAARTAGSLESAELQGLAETDTALQHHGKPEAAKAAEPDLPAFLMNLLVNPRRPLVKVPRHIEAGGWTGAHSRCRCRCPRVSVSRLACCTGGGGNPRTRIKRAPADRSLHMPNQGGSLTNLHSCTPNTP